MVAAQSNVAALAPKTLGPESRVPPHDLDAEAAVLSSILVDTTGLDQVGDVLRAHYFYSEAHNRIYESALAVRERGCTPDVVQVATELKDRERLAQVGGMAYLTEVLNAAPATSRVREYAEIVRGKWIARQVLLTSQRFAAVGFTDYGTPEAYLNDASEALYQISCEHAPTTTRTLSEWLSDNMKAMAEASQRGAQITGLATGFDRYDRMTAGLHAGELTVLAARPGMGKTSLAINMAANIASVVEEGEHPNAVAFLSIEMPGGPVVNRWLCSEARVDHSKVRTGMLTPSDWNKLTAASAAMAQMPVWIDEQSAPTLIDARSKVRRIDTECRRKGRKLRAVFIDYLQLMRAGGGNYSRENEVSEISRGLKQLSKDMAIPVVVLSQINRKSEERTKTGHRPVLSDLRESGAIEQDADNVVFIHREEYYNKETPDRNVAELIIAKQRNGPTDTVRVRFDAQYTRFDNLADGEGYADDGEARYP